MHRLTEPDDNGSNVFTFQYQLNMNNLSHNSVYVRHYPRFNINKKWHLNPNSIGRLGALLTVKKN